MTIPVILPRFIRLRDAPAYLGMDLHRFNYEVRPHLTEIPIGEQGIGFDRLDLDAWADEYKSRNGRRAKGDKLCLNKKGRPALLKGAIHSMSTSRSEVDDFAKALELATTRKRNDTSPAG
jgi:hypothetical protein